MGTCKESVKENIHQYEQYNVVYKYILSGTCVWNTVELSVHFHARGIYFLFFIFCPILGWPQKVPSYILEINHINDFHNNMYKKRDQNTTQKKRKSFVVLSKFTKLFVFVSPKKRRKSPPPIFRFISHF